MKTMVELVGLLRLSRQTLTDYGMNAGQTIEERAAVVAKWQGQIDDKVAALIDLSARLGKVADE